MAKGSADPDKDIKSPPHFDLPAQYRDAAELEEPSDTNGTSFPPPESEKMSTRKRNLRSASPSKAPATPRKIATPRRTNKRGRPAASNALPDTTEEPEEVEGHTVNGDKVIVDVQSTAVPGENGDEERTTHLTVETPADHPELEFPTSTQEALDRANAAIEAGLKLTQGRAAGRKRKAAEISVDPEEEIETALQRTEVQQPAKRVRITEQELRKEKIKRRATMGIAASLAFG